MYNGLWGKCVETLKRHLALPKATWKDERCASMRFISTAYLNQNNSIEAKNWLYRANAEAPHLREPYIDLAMLFYTLKDWSGVLFMIEFALKIVHRSMSYINEPKSWGFTPYDLASLACYHLGLYEKAIAYPDSF